MKNIRTIICLLVLVAVTFMSLAARCLYLQLFKNDFYAVICKKQHQARTIQRPRRGAVLDCRGRVLAASNKIQTVFAEPRIIENPKQTSTKLASILDIPAQEICRAITEGKNPGFAKIKTGADARQCKAARTIYGIGVQSNWQRHYPMGQLAGHVVGFTSLDNRGLGGIELQFDNALAGSSAQNIFLADAFRRPVRPKHQTGAFSNGTGIILTIDATIQQFARAELIKQYDSYRAESAVAIVAQPKTGDILAMVSLPDFNPADIRSADPNNFRNRAISDQFEPGSILKPIVAAIAIDAGVVRLDEKIFCEQGTYHGKGFGTIGEYNNRRYGDMTVREILVKSSNIGMAKIGQRLGKEKLHKGLKIFGFGKKTGIELPGEAEGLLWPVHKWTGYSVTRIPFGQEISVTAIQLVGAFCILANGGHPVRPHLVKATVDSNGQIIHLNQSSNSGIGFVVNQEVARWLVKDALAAVVNEGTGFRAKLQNWRVFGKTGTADIAKANERGYSDSDCVASFIAGAPAEDPAVLVLVSIRKPDKALGKGYTGGIVASPVAAKILEKTIDYLRVGSQ